MKNLRSQIVTGTALALLMASPAAAAPSTDLVQSVDPIVTGPVPSHITLLAQAEQPATENAGEEEEEPGQRRRPRERQAGEGPGGGAEAPAERRARPEGPAEGERRARPERGTPEGEQPARQQAQPEAPADDEGEPQRPRQRQAQPEQPAGEADQPAPRQAQPEEPPAQDQAEPRRPRERQAQPEQPAGEAEQPRQRQAQPEEPPAQDQAEPRRPRERQAQPEQPAGEAEQPRQRQAQPEEPPAQDQTEPQRPRQRQAQPGQPPARQDQTEPRQPGEQAQPGQEAQPEGAAPILDSAKERRRPGDGPRQPGGQEAGQQPQQPRADAPPPPQSDEAAQSDEIRRGRVEPVAAEEGRRLEFGNTREERRQTRRERRERRENTQVVREFDDNRAIIEIDNRVFIESPDNDRLILDRDDVYYEELPRGRMREVITRPDGTKVITIRNRYGDVVRRSRILPDNREVVLVYVEDRYYDDDRGYRDPGADLPPLVLNMPREEYILEAEAVESPDVYYEFFEQPPVEQIQRTYSIDEVKRSARIRDTVRRIDLDTITFEFGSAEIAESEIDELQGVAEAMQRILEQNPGETFLIEGHTDAVGSDLANLALSDRRAEAVAEALTSVFDIPPENLVTQGYGEQYLKVDTEEPERENRRVAMRRITPLVAPVAQAQ